MKTLFKNNNYRLTGYLLIIYTLIFTFIIPTRIFAKTYPVNSSFEKESTGQEQNKDRKVERFFGQTPIYFEKNNGQFDKRVRYKANGPGHTLFLTQSEIVYVLRDGENNKSNPPPKLENLRNNEVKKESAKPKKAVALYMKIVGANEDALMEGTQKQTHNVNYFRGNDPNKWQKDVPTFRKVRYENIYEGIDLEFYGKEDGQIEHDFIVKPNADFRQIELKFEGAENVEIDNDGNLLIETEVGQIKQSAPFSFQKTNELKSEIESGYKLSGENRVKFEVGEYDQTKDLVIDPILSNLAYSTFLGGESDDFGADIEVDSNGNTYIMGRTESTIFPTTSGTLDDNYNGVIDIFVTKLNASGSEILYSTYLGGAAFDRGIRISIDSSGNAFITGDTLSSNFPTTVGSFGTISNGSRDCFVTKINAEGNGLVYSTYIGSIGDDSLGSHAIDIFGKVYITGFTDDNSFPTTPSSFDTTFNGFVDAFLAVLNSTGTDLEYSTFFGGSDFDRGSGIFVDSDDNVYLTGLTGSNDFPVIGGSYDTTINGNGDDFVLKLDLFNNNLVYSTYLGGTDDEFGASIEVDSEKNAYISGKTESFDFPTTPDAFATTKSPADGGFVTKLNATGTELVYSTFIAGSEDDSVSGIKLDSFGNAYVFGSTFSSDFPITNNGFDSTLNGERDGFITKLSADGRFLHYSTFLGGQEALSTEGVSGLTIDSGGNIYVTGFTTFSSGEAFPTTSGAYQTQPNSFVDAYVAKFGNFAISGRTLDENGSPIQDAHIALSGQNSENLFSDGDGNFTFLGAVPNTPYSVSATSAGTIFNPSIFNISTLNSNRELLFIGGGSPSGGGGNQLNFNVSNYNISETGRFAEVKVWRGSANLTDRQNLVGTVSVDYGTSGGTASPGSDYTDINGTLTFTNGEFEKTFLVPINDDLTSESNETINLALSNPTGGAILGSNSNATLTIQDNNEPALQTFGHQIEIVSSSSVLKGKHLAGMAVNSTDGTVYFATDGNVIKPSNGQTNNCGTEPLQDSFELWELATDGTITSIGNYNIRHRGLVNLEFNPNDGEIYTADTNQKVYRINPANGQQNTFNSGVGFDTERFGLQFDSNDDLIMMAYGGGNSFYRVPGGSGSTFLGSYPFDNTNFGDRFGIQPDGDYIVFSDASHQSNARDFEIDTTGHTQGQPYNFAYISNNNIRTLGSSWMTSNGAVDPVNGDVFTAGGNCAAGSSVILRTPLSGTPLMMNNNAQFINNIGNGQTDGAENFNARGVTDLEFGPKRNGQPGNCLYFMDDFNDVIYQSCQLAPTAAGVSISGRVLNSAGTRGVPRAVVRLTNASGDQITARTNPFGYYHFENVGVGQIYTAEVSSKSYVFATRVINLEENLTDLNFLAIAPGTKDPE